MLCEVQKVPWSLSMSRPFIPVPNAVSIELIYTSAGVTLENVLHAYKGSPYSLADIQALRAIIDAWDNTSWKVARPVGIVLTRIRIKGLDTLGSPFEDYALPAPRAGTLAGAQYPNSVCLAVKANSNRTGRSYRGRIYAPCGSIAWAGTTSNDIVAAGANAVVGFLNTLITNLAAAGHTLCVVSYRGDKAWRAEGLKTAIVNWSVVDYHWDSQRRRLTGRGI